MPLGHVKVIFTKDLDRSFCNMEKLLLNPQLFFVFLFFILTALGLRCSAQALRCGVQAL